MVTSSPDKKLRQAVKALQRAHDEIKRVQLEYPLDRVCKGAEMNLTMIAQNIRLTIEVVKP